VVWGRGRLRFCLYMGGGETTPLVCCLWCVMCRVYVSWVVCVHCFCLLSLAFFLLPLRACVRAAVASRVPACECGGSSHGHMPGVSVVVVVVVDLVTLLARSPPTTRHRHQTGAGIDTHSAYRACTPPPPPARQSGGARRDFFLVTITVTNHEHGAAGRTPIPQTDSPTDTDTRRVVRNRRCLCGPCRGGHGLPGSTRSQKLLLLSAAALNNHPPECRGRRCSKEGQARPRSAP